MQSMRNLTFSIKLAHYWAYHVNKEVFSGFCRTLKLYFVVGRLFIAHN